MLFLILLAIFRGLDIALPVMMEQILSLSSLLSLGFLTWRYGLPKLFPSLLPGAKVKYIPRFIGASLQEKLTQELAALNWVKDDVKMGRTEYKLGRATNVFGDTRILGMKPPAIWGNTRQILPWTPAMLRLKTRVEAETGCQYNVCLVNYYADGKDFIHWHSDKEELGDRNSIASISLGEPRHFLFRVKSRLSAGALAWIRIWSGKWWRRYDTVLDLELASGSLLFMGKNCQELYEHTLPRDATVTERRFNLTFRRFHYN